MSSGALFPSLVSGSRSSSSKYLVEFRAGKMTLKGSTVTPDKRKGTVYIQQTDDSLIHFCWKDRTSGNVEDVSREDILNIPDPLGLINFWFAPLDLRSCCFFSGSDHISRRL